MAPRVIHRPVWFFALALGLSWAPWLIAERLVATPGATRAAFDRAAFAAPPTGEASTP